MPETTLPKNYDPKEAEDRLYEFWLGGGYFKPRPPRLAEATAATPASDVRAVRPPAAQPGGAASPTGPDGQTYTIVIPPPNVTGILHMGHAVNNTIQDILVRTRRMQGYRTLWLPGTDHAGLATQIKVEERLRDEEGLSRHDLGRERFVERVWGWKAQYAETIDGQLKKLGTSCDWSRERFTMDEGLSRAVREAFVRYWEKGLIYRGKRMIQWCPLDQTALSDIEVEHEDQPTKLYHVRYPLAEGEGGITIATVRPETILADVGVAVHPDDSRYKDLVGRTVRLPLVGRLMPIVADAYADPSFGSGAVKITPAHDPNDYEMGLRHGLPVIEVIGPDGRMTAEADPYAGLTREECRRRIVGDLAKVGALVKIEDHTSAIGTCARCGTVVEPRLSEQWFVRMKPLAEPDIEAVRQKDIRIVPERFEKIYLHWMENIRDWCISRQIWWGHRIPVWYCRDCGQMIVSRTDPSECPCGSHRLEQDPDCLDTWFSSALWPFSTLGWPEETDDLATFYPTSTLVTAYEIIFLWVARMIMSGLEFMGRKPFDDVLIHGIMRDGEGRKMSKSLGNGIDPLEVIDRYGADALRFMLVAGVSPGNDMRFYWEKVEGARNFANKLWNASRFVLMNLEGFAADDLVGDVDAARLAPDAPLADRWLRSRLERTAADVTRLIDQYELGEAARLVYDFTWSDYCDWYIELSKARLRAGGETRRRCQQVLVKGLTGILRLLHPFMPFVTEEIWQHLARAVGTGAAPPAAPEATGGAAVDGLDDALIVAPWPGFSGLADERAEADMGQVMEVIRAIRNLRAEAGVAPGRRAPVVVSAGSEQRALLERESEAIHTLAQVTAIDWLGLDQPGPEKALAAVAGQVQVYLPLEGLIDLERERERLLRELEAQRAELARARQKLENPNFVSRAPAEVVAKEREREANFAAAVATLQERLALLAGGR